MATTEEEIETTGDKVRRFGRKIRRAAKQYNVRQRRKRASSKKGGTGRKLLAGLSILLILLLGAFFAAQEYLSPHDVGTEVSFDELSALAEEHRIETAVFNDQDKRLTGIFAVDPVIPLPEKKDKKDEKGKDEKGKGAAPSASPSPSPSGSASPAAAGGNAGDKKNDTKKKKEEVVEEPSRAPIGADDFWLEYPASDAAFGVLADMVQKAGARVTIDQQTDKAIVRNISQYLLPLLILATFFGLLFSAGRGGGSGIGEVLTFGSIGKKRQKRGFTTPITFGDVAGADEAVAEMREVVDYLKDPDRYEEIGASPPKGILLFGPPGCGKTLIAKAVAGEAGVPFFSVAGAEFVESLVGVGAARVRDLFQRVRAVAPAIVFIDELDAAGRRRGYGGSGGGGSDEREQTLNQLLVEMDGFEVSTGIVVVGATNRPDIIDPALIRPGRFDRHITVDQPDAEGRELILELHARGKPIKPDTDWGYLAKRTPGFSGADLANVINEAALLTVREKKPEIETIELEEAIQRVLHGPKRRGRLLSEEESKRAAYHETGHAIVAAAAGRSADVHRVSILARGKGLGLTGVLRNDTDALLLTRNQLLGQLVTSMAGMASEELIFGEPSTGAEQDLEEATELARDIIGRFGMSPTLGRARLLASDAEQYLGGDSGLAKLSDHTHTAMDTEVARLLEAAEAEATRILKAHRTILDVMAKQLEEDETLEGIELDRFLRKVQEEKIKLNSIFGATASTNGATKRTGAKKTTSRKKTTAPKKTTRRRT